MLADVRRLAARLPRLLPALPLVGALACADATSPGTSSAPAAGTWNYEAHQLSPSLTLEGTVGWQGVPGSTTAFEGSYHLLERFGPTVRTVTGPSAGQVLRDSIVEFAISLDGAERLHIGVLRADSLTGEWVHIGNPTASGSFRMRRNPAP